MRKPFDKDFNLSQDFGNDLVINGVHIYKEYGLLGHNGLDYSMPTGSRVLAPHDGKIIESTLDLNGYGIYVKIENSVEGSVLAHFKEARVGVGDGVKEGDLIGYSNNTGNSTGPHLHWGYYRFPRDRTNGFAGFIDQTPYLGQQNTSSELQGQLDTCRLDRDSHHNDRMAMYEELGFTGTFNLVVAVEEIKKLRNIDTQVKEKDEQLSEAQTEINDLKGMLDHYQKINLDLTEKATDLSERADELEKDYVKTSLNYREAMGRIEALQKLIDKPALTGWKKLIVDLISKL